MSRELAAGQLCPGSMPQTTSALHTVGMFAPPLAPVSPVAAAVKGEAMHHPPLPPTITTLESRFYSTDSSVRVGSECRKTIATSARANTELCSAVRVQPEAIGSRPAGARRSIIKPDQLSFGCEFPSGSISL